MKKNSILEGFTLLELLIALTFFSVVMIVVGSVFGTGIAAWRRGEEEGGFTQELRLALDRMGVELRNFLPYEDRPLEGSETLLSFLELQSPHVASEPPEWIQVTYEVQKTGTGTSLLRRVRPFSEGEEEEDILLSSLSDIRFSFPIFETETNWRWSDRWESSEGTTAPPFIRMELTLAEGERWEKFFFIPTGTKGIGTE